MKYNKEKFKLISIISLIVIMIIAIMGIVIKSADIYATEYKDSSGVTYTLSGTTLKITGTGKVTNIWKDKAELGTSLPTTITAVTIGKEITEIDASAFEGCTALTKVTFSTGVTCTSIGNKAFKGCSALTNIVNVTTANTLPKTITTIGDEAFSGCSKLAKLNLNTGVTTIGANAFKENTSLATLTIYNIQNATNAFKGNTALTTLTIGNTCTNIQDNMFEGCTELTTVTFASGSTCTSIGNSSFKGCTKLNNIKNNTTANTLPASITTIGNEAFSGCTSLKTVAFASNSTCSSIGNSAFDGCTSLTTFTIPDQVATIEPTIFRGCTSLNTLTVGTGVTSIGKNAFNDAPLTTKLTYNATNCTTYNSAFAGKQIPSVEIGKTVTTIPENFIKGNKAIKKIIIPTAVTNIKSDAFNDAPVDNGIWIKNPNCTIETTSTISKNTTVFVQVPKGKNYVSFNGVDSSGNTFSSLLKYLYENDFRYVPFSIAGYQENNTQSVIDHRGSKKGFISTVGDYGYKAGVNGGKEKEWISAVISGGSGTVSAGSLGNSGKQYFVVPAVAIQRMECLGKASGSVTSGEFTAYEKGEYSFWYSMWGCSHTRWQLVVTLEGLDANNQSWSKSYTSANSDDSGLMRGSVEFPSSGTYKVTFNMKATKADSSEDHEDVGIIVFGDSVRGPKRTVTCIDMAGNTKLGETTRENEWGVGEKVKGSDFGDNTTLGFYYDGYVYNSCTEATVTEAGATVYRYFISTNKTLTVEPAGGIWNSSADKQTISLAEGSTKDIPLPSREGYIFKGWTLTGKGSTMTSLVEPATFTMGTENATLTAKWEPIPEKPVLKGELEISKTGEYLKETKTREDGTIEPVYEEGAMQGVEFEIYAKEDIYSQNNQRTRLYKKDQVVGKIVTNSQGKASLDNLSIGKYYVKEVKTVEGFILNKEIKEFEIKSGGEGTLVQKVEMSYKNERQKIDLNGKEGLKVEKIADKTVYQPGEQITYKIKVSNTSEYTIKDIKVEETIIEGQFEDIQTDNVTKTGDKTVEIKELKPGETVELKFIVAIAEDEQMIEKVKVTNKIKAIGKIEKPGKDPEPIEGEDDEEVYITNKKLVVVKEALKKEYQIGETAQYIIKVINNGKEDINKILIEEQMLDGKFVYLEELNEEGLEIAVEGQKVAINKLKSGETVILRYEYTVTENTKVTLTEEQKMILPNTVIGKGKVETKDPVDPEKTITEEVQDESTEEIQVTDLDKNHIGIIKKDIETGEVLQGATIGLYAMENITDKQGKTIIAKDTLIEKAITNKYGKAKYSVDLPLGRYYIKELEAPAGYKISQEIVEIDGTYKGPEIEEISVSKTLGDVSIKEKKMVNFSVEKTLSSIILNGEPIKITNNKLEKLEVKTSEVKKTELIATYNIKVRNEGEVKGKVTVLDTIPDGYEILEAPEYWKQKEDGTLQTEVELEVGESKDLSVTLRWTNNENNLGSRTNRAQLEGQVDDANPEDDISEATIVVSIKTGEVVSIIIIGMIIIALAISGYVTYIVIRKKGPDINRIRFLR